MLTGWRHLLLWHCHRYAGRQHVSTIPLHNLRWLRTSDVDRFNERKWPYTGKGKRQIILRTNYYRCRLRWWHNVSSKYIRQAESLLYSLERVAGGIVLHVKAGKTEYMCFNKSGYISALNGDSLKLVHKFTYLGSSISSTENDINMWLAKAWTAIYRLSVIWKSDLSDKIKRNFFQAAGCLYYYRDAPLERWLIA